MKLTASSLPWSALLFTLSVSVFVSHCPCLVQPLHPVPFNKIKPNRKHSKEINLGLQRLCCPFGFSTTAATKSLSVSFLYSKKGCWVNQDVLSFSLHHNKVEVKLVAIKEERLCKVVLSVSDCTDTVRWSFLNCYWTSRCLEIWFLPLPSEPSWFLLLKSLKLFNL